MFSSRASRKRGPGRTGIHQLPPFLDSEEALETLGRLLVEFDDFRAKLPMGNPGGRVRDHAQARRLLDDVMKTARDVLDIDETRIPPPEVVLSHILHSLRNKTTVLAFIYVPVAVLFLAYTFGVSESGPALWLARGAACFLLAAPFLIVRRTRIYAEHLGGYARNRGHGPAIVIEQLPEVQFQSYLSYGYACHIYYYLAKDEDRKELREGWARLVQWKIAQELYRRDGKSAHLAYPLDQILGELKFVYTLVSKGLGRSNPARIRSIRTMYIRNPVVRLLTGWPGFIAMSLVEHGIGAAVYFLSDRHTAVLRPLPAGVLDKDAGAST
ncbi:MAG: hypothetical protein HY788_22335 [Deltaproteobacteria bacterium]|nr:hypothetical protein [Deltaproteobacteria bacterium]